MYLISMPNRSDLCWNVEDWNHLREIAVWNEEYAAYVTQELPEHIPGAWMISRLSEEEMRSMGFYEDRGASYENREDIIL